MLQILQVNATDSGKYQCVAKNVARKRTGKMHQLTVTEGMQLHLKHTSILMYIAKDTGYNYKPCLS